MLINIPHYCLLVIIFIVAYLSSYQSHQYEQMKDKPHHHETKKQVIVKKEESSSSSSDTIRTCYMTNSGAFPPDCFNQDDKGLYINAVKNNFDCYAKTVGKNYIPPSYMNDQSKEKWGMLNYSGPPLTKADVTTIKQCLNKNPNWTGFFIDHEDHCDPSTTVDLSSLGFPSRSVVGAFKGGVPQVCKYNNPVGHEYILMCYDGQKCTPNDDGSCSTPPNTDALKQSGINISRYMYNSDYQGAKCTPSDSYVK